MNNLPRSGFAILRSCNSKGRHGSRPLQVDVQMEPTHLYTTALRLVPVSNLRNQIIAP